MEALALADHARRCARSTTTLTGEEVDGLDLDSFDAVPEVAGIADTWWRGTDSLIAIYRGEAEVMHAPGPPRSTPDSMPGGSEDSTHR